MPCSIPYIRSQYVATTLSVVFNTTTHSEHGSVHIQNITLAFHRAKKNCKQASFRLVHMHETLRAHVEHCYKEKPQTERILFTNSSSSTEGHVNKVIFSTCH